MNNEFAAKRSKCSPKKPRNFGQAKLTDGPEVVEPRRGSGDAQSERAGEKKQAAHAQLQHLQTEVNAAARTSIEVCATDTLQDETNGASAHANASCDTNSISQHVQMRHRIRTKQRASAWSSKHSQSFER